MGEKFDWKKELMQIMRILQENGVDPSKIQISYTDERGNRSYIILKDIKQDGIDIEKIITENQLDGNFKIGQKLHRFKAIYNGSHKGELSEEERKMAEELGIVKIVPCNRQKPLFKGRKISQFHVDIVRANIDKILTGELSNTDVIKIINEQAIMCNETQILDNGTIRRIVELVLDGKPEELKRYKETLQKNVKKNLSREGGSGRRKELSPDYISTVINNYLPRYISGEITIDIIEEELKTSRKTLDRIIIGHYIELGDSEGLKQYETIKKNNSGASKEQRKAAKKMRQEVAEYEIVSDAEFLLLSEEEQDIQIIEKYMKEKLKQASKNESTGRISTKEYSKQMLEKTKSYFRTKNDVSKGIENFSEQDIRYIIFRYPSILGRDAQTLDEKFDVLTAYDEIDEQTACAMIKSFPAVIGYSVERTKAQLDLLQKENLIDSVISKPRGMMKSVNLMYALIEYAKQRHRTTDLSEVRRSNIFMSNGTLKNVYGITYDELKVRFPYEGSRDEEDTTYDVKGQDIGIATYKNVTVEKADEAFDIVSKACERQQKKEVK